MGGPQRQLWVRPHVWRRRYRPLWFEAHTSPSRASVAQVAPSAVATALAHIRRVWRKPQKRRVCHTGATLVNRNLHMHVRMHCLFQDVVSATIFIYGFNHCFTHPFLPTGFTHSGRCILDTLSTAVYTRSPAGVKRVGGGCITSPKSANLIYSASPSKATRGVHSVRSFSP